MLFFPVDEYDVWISFRFVFSYSLTSADWMYTMKHVFHQEIYDEESANELALFVRSACLLIPQLNVYDRVWDT